MHVLIATDGRLSPVSAADFALRLAGDDGKVTILTVVEVPRMLLTELRRVFGESDSEVLILDHEEVSTKPSGSPRASGWPGDDAVINRYLEDQKESRTRELVAAIEDRSGRTPTVEVRESEKAASEILAAIDELKPDVTCIGSHGRGRFEGLLGSTGTKIARLATCPVLLLRDRR